jgi:hypothetical protein
VKAVSLAAPECLSTQTVYHVGKGAVGVKVRLCALCECPIPLWWLTELCGACALEWQRLQEMAKEVEDSRRSDWLDGSNHITKQHGAPSEASAREERES